MATETQNRGGNGFMIGLLTGACAGAGLALWLAPRMAGELRERLTESARALNDRAAARYEDASTRMRETVDDITTRGRAVRDDVADVVASGAREVERVALSVKT